MTEAPANPAKPKLNSQGLPESFQPSEGPDLRSTGVAAPRCTLDAAGGAQGPLSSRPNKRTSLVLPTVNVDESPVRLLAIEGALQRRFECMKLVAGRGAQDSPEGKQGVVGRGW